MARKKKEPELKKNIDTAHVEGLRAEVLEQPITDTLTGNYMPYAMSVIVSRAIPEIDGFKPSHRKLLYTMYKMGLLNGGRTKSANIVGQTMRLNPHGDAAIYETMVRLARGNEALLTPFVDSKGNFGKVYSRDMAYAASRYTEAKLDPICAELFRDIDSETVDFVDNYDNTMLEPSLLPTTYPLILSGDHIYKMDYNAMLQYHIRKGADATIAVRPVPWEEASRFGIMNTDADDNIVEFEEKPKQPKSNKASMGIYIFSWAKLRAYLTADEADKTSANDFGKNIIPAMLNDKQVMVAYNFEGYWKDVGTIESLWEANMDLLSVPMPIDLHDKKWRIYAKNPGLAPHYIAKGAVVSDSLVTEGSEVYGSVQHSVIFAGVTIEEGASVIDSVVMPYAVIKRGAVVRRAIVAENAVIGAGCVVGEETGNIAVVGQGVTLPAGVSVTAGQQVDENTKF